MMTEGKITVIVNDCEHVLEKGDALYFDASVPHCYINREAETAKMVLLIQYL